MTNEEFDEILERTNAVVCNRDWYERAAKALEQQDKILQILDYYDLEAWEILEKIKKVVRG